MNYLQKFTHTQIFPRRRTLRSNTRMEKKMNSFSWIFHKVWCICIGRISSLWLFNVQSGSFTFILLFPFHTHTLLRIPLISLLVVYILVSISSRPLILSAKLRSLLSFWRNALFYSARIINGSFFYIRFFIRKYIIRIKI